MTHEHTPLPLRLASVAVAALLLVPAAASAWGFTGHRAVGEVASNHLTPETERALAEIMGHESLARAGTWADEIRSLPEWRKADDWHWVTIPDGMTYAETEKNPKGDVLEAIARFTAVLADAESSRQAKVEAVRFLTHFVGDVHQPLHVGTGADRGGNQVLVLWFGEPTNLHRVWDSGVIDRMELSFTELVRFIDHPTADEVADWQAASFEDWAAESMALRPLVYDLGDRELSWDYLAEARPVVERRILQAGVRLAGLFNRVLGAGE